MATLKVRDSEKFFFFFLALGNWNSAAGSIRPEQSDTLKKKKKKVHSRVHFNQSNSYSVTVSTCAAKCHPRGVGGGSGVIYHREVAGAWSAEGRGRERKALLKPVASGGLSSFPLTRAECVISASSETFSGQTPPTAILFASPGTRGACFCQRAFGPPVDFPPHAPLHICTRLHRAVFCTSLSPDC